MLCIYEETECTGCMACRNPEERHCPNCLAPIREDTEVYFMDGLLIGCEHCVHRQTGEMEVLCGEDG